MRVFYVFSIDYQLISHRRPIVAEAVRRGWDVTVVCKETGYRSTIEDMGVRFIEIPINRVGTNPREELRTLLYLYRLYKREKPDLVHHVSTKVVLWGGLAAKMAGVPCVVNAINGLGTFFQNGKADTLTKKAILQIIKYSHRREKVTTILQNEDDKAFFTNHHAIPEEKIRIIQGSGVDLSEFCYTEEIPVEPLKLILTSRMLREKGIFDVISAAQMLKKKYEGRIAFQLCGLIEQGAGAISKEELLPLCDGSYIQYLGQRNDVKELLKQSAIALLPSYYREGIPKSLIEATAIGRPIITTDSVGCRETVIDGENGFLIPVKSPEILAQKIDILVSDAALRHRMGLASRRIAEEKFSIASVIERHFEIYSSLLDK